VNPPAVAEPPTSSSKINMDPSSGEARPVLSLSKGWDDETNRGDRSQDDDLPATRYTPRRFQVSGSR
jgi:hypothetical protein